MLALAPFAHTLDHGRDVVLHKTVADTTEAVLLVPGLVQNRFSFEVPTRSLPRHLAAHGFTTYCLELFGRGSDKRAFARGDTLLDYVDHDLRWAIDQVTARHQRVALVGHSMGGLLSLLLDAADQRRLDRLAVIASPLFVDSHSAVVDGAFAALAPLARTLGRGKLSFPGQWLTGPLLATRRALDWPGLSFPFQFFVPGSLEPEVLRFFLAKSFHQDSLRAVADLMDPDKGAQRLGRALSVPPGLPVLVLGAAGDRLATKDGVLALYDRLARPGVELCLFDDDAPAMGHVDLLVGKHAPAHTWPRLLRFLRPPPL